MRLRSDVDLDVAAVSRAASSAASASASGKRAVTIAVGSTTPLARKRIVCGHRPAEPMMPRDAAAPLTGSGRAWSGARPMSMPTNDQPALVAGELAAPSPSPRARQRLEHDVEAATLGELGHGVREVVGGRDRARGARPGRARRRGATAGLDQRHRGVVAAAAATHSSPIGPAADDRDLIGRVEPAAGVRGAVSDRERLHQAPAVVGQLLGQDVQPFARARGSTPRWRR